MNRLCRLLAVCGLLLLGGVAVGCRSPQRTGDGPLPAAPIPPQSQAGGNGLLLNNGSLLLGPGAGGRNGYRVIGDGEWGFLDR